MNYNRLALAAVAATVADVAYGFLVYGVLLANEFAKFPGVYRSAESGPAYLPLMFCGLFVANVALSAIYAKGYEGGSGAAEGLRFGVLVAVFVVMVFAGVNYATLNIGRRISLELAVAGLVEWALVGTVIGVVYSPAAAVARRPSAI